MNHQGKVSYEAKKKQWRVEAPPHIVIRLKRVFGKLSRKRHDTIFLSDTEENARDLAWFIDRFPMLVEDPGHYVRCCHETCIIAARLGAAARIKAHNIPSVFFAPVGAHSVKPAAFYEIVERLAPGPYLDLFARASRGTGWTAIGDELGSTLDLPLAPSRSA